MVLNLIRKVALGSAIVSGVLATGLGSYHIYRAPTTIGQALEKRGLKLLNDNKGWKELARKHFLLEKDQESDKAVNEIKKINGLNLKETGRYDDSEIAEKLEKKCKDLWDTELSKVNEESRKRIEEEIENWCVSNAKNLNN